MVIAHGVSADESRTSGDVDTSISARAAASGAVAAAMVLHKFAIAPRSDSVEAVGTHGAILDRRTVGYEYAVQRIVVGNAVVRNAPLAERNSIAAAGSSIGRIFLVG